MKAKALAVLAVLPLFLSCAAGPAAPRLAVGAAEAPGPSPTSGTHPRILLNAAERKRLEGALAGGQGAATRFVRAVDAQLAGANYFAFSFADPALLWQLTRRPRYAEYAVTSMDRLVSSEEALIARGERPVVASDSYHGVGGIIGDLALIHDWAHDRLTRGQRERWLRYANQAVWNVWHPAQASWGGKPFPWNGWSVNNPGNNYYYSFLRATMLLGLTERGEDPRGDEWIQLFRDKIDRELVPYFNEQVVGGGSREGTGYGTAQGNLFALFYLWQQSTGESLRDRMPHTRASLLYLMHATVPTLDRIAPIGDHSRDSLALFYDYHRAYVEILARLFEGEPESRVAETFLARCGVPQMGQASNLVSDFVYAPPEREPLPLSALRTVYHGVGTGQVFLRSSWDGSGATWAAFTAGPYTESHAHQDQGQLLVFKNEWLAIDENLYSHSGLRQEPEAHNLVRLERDGATLRQRLGQGSRLLALRDEPRFTWMASDAAPVYDPAQVAALGRSVLFLKPDVFVVFDRVEAKDPAVRAVWQLNAPVQPSDPAHPPVVIAGGKSRLEIHPIIAPGGARVLAWPRVDGDLNGGFRIDEPAPPGSTVFLHVLSLDGAVKSAARVGDRGVALALADGRRATVTFAEGGQGTLELRGAGGGVELAAPLQPVVDAIPAFAR